MDVHLNVLDKIKVRPSQSLFDLNSKVFTMTNNFKGPVDQSTKHAVTNLMALLHYTSIYPHTLHKCNCDYNLSHPLKWEYILTF